MKTNKSYGCKDADMILAAEFIAKNLKAKLNVLGGICKYWTEPYSDDLIARVEFAIIYYLNKIKIIQLSYTGLIYQHQLII